MTTSRTDTEFLVLGGGISGLMAARALQDLGHEVVLLERAPGFGGLTRTVEVDNYRFDYTGHFLHLGRFRSPSQIPFADLDDEAWQRVDRKSACFVADTFVPAPIQYNIGLLPEPERSRCIASYHQRPPVTEDCDRSFRSYIVSGFGEYLADLFLIPQNEKTQAIELDELAPIALKRFFPKPDERRVEAGIRQVSVPSNEYNSNFWYPRHGGIGLLPNGLANGIEQALPNHEVVHVDPSSRTLTCQEGKRFSWRTLVSSLPLKQLCQRIDDPNLNRMGSELTNSTTISFNLGLAGEPAEPLNGVHWIYVPDRQIPFYRVGCYSNISPGTCSLGHHSLYVEVSIRPDELGAIDIGGALQTAVIDHLARLGWIRPSAVRAVVAHVIEYAYTHDRPNRADLVARIQDRLRSFDTYTIGRYGQWDYNGMEDSMQSALDLVERIG